MTEAHELNYQVYSSQRLRLTKPKFKDKCSAMKKEELNI